MPHILETRRIVLRPAVNEDLPTLSAWEDTKDYLEFVSSQKGAKYFFRFIIERKRGKGSVPLGILYTFSYNKADGYMFLNIFLDSNHRNAGYGAEACALAIRHIFESFPVYKIYCDAYSSNPKAVSMMRGIGLEQEGFLKGHRLYNGKRYDVIRFAVYQRNLCAIEDLLQRIEKR